MANKLLKILDVEFDENLTPKQVNVGTATQTSERLFKLHVVVPNIDLQKDSCYVACELPVKKRYTNKNSKIKLPYNLNSSFDFYKTIDGIDYYHTYIDLDSRVLKYAGDVKLNVVIEHLTGEITAIDYEDNENEYNQMEIVDTRSSETFTISVTRSSNYDENLYPEDEDEYDEAVVHIDAILKFLAAYQSYAPAKKDTLQILDSKPNDISNFNGLYYFKDKNEVDFIKDGKVEQVIFEDQFLEYDNKNSFPPQGEYGRIYLDESKNRIYHWKDNKYIEISPSLELGETESTAYAGNKGKANADAIKNLQDNKLDTTKSWKDKNNNKLSYKFETSDKYFNFKTRGNTRVQYNVLDDTLYYKDINRITYEIPNSSGAPYWQVRFVDGDKNVLTALTMSDTTASLYATDTITIGGKDENYCQTLNFRNLMDVSIKSIEMINMETDKYSIKAQTQLYTNVNEIQEFRIGDSSEGAVNAVGKIGMYKFGTGEYEGSTIEIGGAKQTYLKNLVFDMIENVVFDVDDLSIDSKTSLHKQTYFNDQDIFYVVDNLSTTIRNELFHVIVPLDNNTISEDDRQYLNSHPEKCILYWKDTLALFRSENDNQYLFGDVYRNQGSGQSYYIRLAIAKSNYYCTYSSVHIPITSFAGSSDILARIEALENIINGGNE